MDVLTKIGVLMPRVNPRTPKHTPKHTPTHTPTVKHTTPTTVKHTPTPTKVTPPKQHTRTRNTRQHTTHNKPIPATPPMQSLIPQAHAEAPPPMNNLASASTEIHPWTQQKPRSNQGKRQRQHHAPPPTQAPQAPNPFGLSNQAQSNAQPHIKNEQQRWSDYSIQKEQPHGGMHWDNPANPEPWKQFQTQPHENNPKRTIEKKWQDADQWEGRNWQRGDTEGIGGLPPNPNPVKYGSMDDTRIIKTTDSPTGYMRWTGHDPWYPTEKANQWVPFTPNVEYHEHWQKGEGYVGNPNVEGLRESAKSQGLTLEEFFAKKKAYDEWVEHMQRVGHASEYQQSA